MRKNVSDYANNFVINQLTTIIFLDLKYYYSVILYLLIAAESGALSYIL